MASQYRLIRFSAFLRDSLGETMNKAEFHIQTFDHSEERWLNLSEKAIISIDGAINFSYHLGADVKPEVGSKSRGNSINEIISNVIKVGGMPVFRLVRNVFNIEESSTQVLGRVYDISMDAKEKMLSLDFGSLHLLEEEYWSKPAKFDDSVIAASSFSLASFSAREQKLEDKIKDLENQLKNNSDCEEKLIQCEEKLAQCEGKLHGLELQVSDLRSQNETLRNENDDLKRELDNCEQELIQLREQHQNEVNELLQQISGLQAQIEILQEEKNNCEQELLQLREQHENEVNELLQQISDLQAQVETLQAENDVLKRERDNCREELIQLREQYEREINILNQQISDLQADIGTLQEENDELKRQRDECKQELTQLREEHENELNILNQQISDLQADILILETKNSDLQTENEDLRKRLDDMDVTNMSVPAAAIYSNILSEVSSVNENMAGQGYKLANISVDLKTLVTQSPDGLLFMPIDSTMAHTVNGEAVSDIKIDVAEEPVIAPQETLIPTVIGLTETAARKLLAKYNLKIDPVYQYLNLEQFNDSDYVIGQAFKQSPSAGEEITIRDTVTVVFAKIQST